MDADVPFEFVYEGGGGKKKGGGGEVEELLLLPLRWFRLNVPAGIQSSELLSRSHWLSPLPPKNLREECPPPRRCCSLPS